jgi:hypothetical protein
MDVGDGLGQPTWPIEHEGRHYRARVIDQQVKDAFASWLARRVIHEFLAACGDGQYDQAVALVADRIAEGRYGFHGEIAQRALQQPDGVLALTRLVFDVSPPGHPWRAVTEAELTALMSAKGPEVKAVMQQVFARSFPRAVKAPQNGEGESQDPNPAGAGEKTPSAPPTPSSSSTPG